MIISRKMKFYNIRDLESIKQLKIFSEEELFDIKVVSNVLPFRTNNYVVEELIDWENVPDDPIFRLTFMQREMLFPEHFQKMADALKGNKSAAEIKTVANQIRYELNPHPAAQITANIPIYNEEKVPGVQHKYNETVLIFPSSGQTCHAYCTFCFRWAQFVGISDLKFATDESSRFQNYLKQKKYVSDILFTGGDPMIMSQQKLGTYIEPLLEPEFDHIRNIRIGTKSLSYWPYRYVTDSDADGILRLFEKIVDSGKHLTIMAHFNHWVESSTDIVRKAISRIRNTGAEIRTQSPLIKHINDDPLIWSRMWKEQVSLGMIPYYMFVERNTGANHYFCVPLAEAFKIYQKEYNNVSGLSRTARGPSMSAAPGKIVIEGIAKILGEKVFVLNFLQGRNKDWVKKPFFAEYDETAKWLDELTPAFGEPEFFYEREFKELIQTKVKRFKSVSYREEDTSIKSNNSAVG